MCEKFTVETMQAGNTNCTARVYKGAKLLSPHRWCCTFTVVLSRSTALVTASASPKHLPRQVRWSSRRNIRQPVSTRSRRRLRIAYSILTSMRARCPEFAHKKSMLFVAGEEAGGNIAAGVALMARDQYLTDLKGQILLSPMLDPCLATASFRKYCAESAVQTMSDGWQHYLGECAGFTHPYAAPALCTRLAGLTPTLLVTSAQCPMRDETQAYAERLRQAGVKVQSHVLPGKAGWIAETRWRAPTGRHRNINLSTCFPISSGRQEQSQSQHNIRSKVLPSFDLMSTLKPAPTGQEIQQ